MTAKRVQKRKPTATDKFYRWFERQYPGTSVICDGFSRAQMRLAYEAGFANARRLK